MFMGLCPGDFHMTSALDAHRQESQRDFGDPIGITSRALVEGLFGIQPNLIANSIRIRPGFPAGWNRASLHHKDFDLAWKREAMSEILRIHQPPRQVRPPHPHPPRANHNPPHRSLQWNARHLRLRPRSRRFASAHHPSPRRAQLQDQRGVEWLYTHRLPPTLATQRSLPPRRMTLFLPATAVTLAPRSTIRSTPSPTSHLTSPASTPSSPTCTMATASGPSPSPSTPSPPHPPSRPSQPSPQPRAPSRSTSLPC